MKWADELIQLGLIRETPEMCSALETFLNPYIKKVYG